MGNRYICVHSYAKMGIRPVLRGFIAYFDIYLIPTYYQCMKMHDNALKRLRKDLNE